MSLVRIDGSNLDYYGLVTEISQEGKVQIEMTMKHDQQSIRDSLLLSEEEQKKAERSLSKGSRKRMTEIKTKLFYAGVERPYFYLQDYPHLKEIELVVQVHTKFSTKQKNENEIFDIV